MCVPAAWRFRFFLVTLPMCGSASISLFTVLAVLAGQFTDTAKACGEAKVVCDLVSAPLLWCLVVNSLLRLVLWFAMS